MKTADPILKRFKSYNAFEKCDFLSLNWRLNPLVYLDLHAEAIVQHYHAKNFIKTSRSNLSDDDSWSMQYIIHI